jgi:two-component system, chemotaxis family, chemotaxis protein CheY
MRHPPHFTDMPILVVDRSPHNRRTIRQILLQVNLRRVFEAEAVASASAILLYERPSVIILDWDLPGAGGLTLLQSIRNRATSPIPQVPVIAMMDRPMRSEVLLACTSGANEVVMKPISPKNLWVHLSGVIRIKRKFEVKGKFLIPEQRAAPEMDFV